MANRYFQDTVLSLVKRRVEIPAVVDVGTAGAVTLLKRSYYPGQSTTTSLAAAPTTGVGYAVGDGNGVRSVSRTGTGAWTVTLSDAFQYLLGVQLMSTVNTTGVMTAASVGVLSGSTNVQTNTSTGSGGVIALLFNDFAGAAVDPASGDRITLLFTLGDATEP